MENYLILHCAPTLAGIKTANLFSYTFTSQSELMNSLLLVNEKLNSKGVYAEILRIRNSNALSLVYRKSLLNSDFSRKGVKDFLRLCGYDGNLIDNFIQRLKVRFDCSRGFPHEIGLFLGYPLQDVIGFIENEGKNSKCAGCWKVYTNEYEAVRIFAKYRKCKNVYTKLFFQGRSIEGLTIAA